MKDNWLNTLLSGASKRETTTLHALRLPEADREIDLAVFHRLRERIEELTGAPGEALTRDIQDVRNDADRVGLKTLLTSKLRSLPKPTPAPVPTPFERANTMLASATTSLENRRTKLMEDIARDTAELFEVNVVLEALGSASGVIYHAANPDKIVEDQTADVDAALTATVAGSLKLDEADAVPDNTYYNPDTNNFYFMDTHKGRGINFYGRWHSRRDEFPHSQGEPSPIMFTRKLANHKAV